MSTSNGVSSENLPCEAIASKASTTKVPQLAGGEKPVDEKRESLSTTLVEENLGKVVAELTPFYGDDCPVAVVFRASWPDEKIIRSTLGGIEAALDPSISRTALIFVGPSIGGETFDESRLYAADYDRRYRPQTADSPWSEWRHGDD